MDDKWSERASETACSLFVRGAALQLRHANNAPDFSAPHLKQIAVAIIYNPHQATYRYPKPFNSLRKQV
jgi:hypothetical protein